MGEATQEATPVNTVTGHGKAIICDKRACTGAKAKVETAVTVPEFMYHETAANTSTQLKKERRTAEKNGCSKMRELCVVVNLISTSTSVETSGSSQQEGQCRDANTIVVVLVGVIKSVAEHAQCALQASLLSVVKLCLPCCCVPSCISAISTLSPRRMTDWWRPQLEGWRPMRKP